MKKIVHKLLLLTFVMLKPSFPITKEKVDYTCYKRGVEIIYPYENAIFKIKKDFNSYPDKKKKELAKFKQSFEKNFIYTGCQILNKNLFNEYEVENFSVAKIWNKLLMKQELNGFESTNKFHHLTNLEIFKKLKGL